MSPTCFAIMQGLLGVEIRPYTELDCKAATGLWLGFLSRSERDQIAQLAATRCRNPNGMSLYQALARRGR